jgi:uncharacterized protein YqeY
MIFEKINKDKETFMKAKAKNELTEVRLLLAEIKNEEINVKHKLSDEDTFVVIKKLTKQIGESRDYAVQVNDSRRISEYEGQLKILNSYLPEQISEEKLEDMVKQIITENNFVGKRDMGKVMAIIMPMIKGKADNKLVSSITSRLLNK